jgi:hypothetical protein
LAGVDDYESYRRERRAVTQADLRRRAIAAESLSLMMSLIGLALLAVLILFAMMMLGVTFGGSYG